MSYDLRQLKQIPIKNRAMNCFVIYRMCTQKLDAAEACKNLISTKTIFRNEQKMIEQEKW